MLYTHNWLRMRCILYTFVFIGVIVSVFFTSSFGRVAQRNGAFSRWVRFRRGVFGLLVGARSKEM